MTKARIAQCGKPAIKRSAEFIPSWRGVRLDLGKKTAPSKRNQFRAPGRSKLWSSGIIKPTAGAVGFIMPPSGLAERIVCYSETLSSLIFFNASAAASRKDWEGLLSASVSLGMAARASGSIRPTTR